MVELIRMTVIKLTGPMEVKEFPLNGFSIYTIPVLATLGDKIVSTKIFRSTQEEADAVKPGYVFQG